MGRKYQKRLNINSKQTVRYRAGVFTPATAYVRCIVPYFKNDCRLGYNFVGNNKNVRIRLNSGDVVAILQRWATCKCKGDESKGEQSVTYFGRDVYLTYSFVTNQLAFKFCVTDDSAAKRKKAKGKQAEKGKKIASKSQKSKE